MDENLNKRLEILGWIEIGIILFFDRRVVFGSNYNFPNAVDENEQNSQDKGPMILCESINSVNGHEPSNNDFLYQLKDIK